MKPISLRRAILIGIPLSMGLWALSGCAVFALLKVL